MMTTSGKTILKVDASARRDGSMTRDLSAELVERLVDAAAGSNVISRDVASGLPFVDEAWIGANMTDPSERSAEQNAVLELSDTLISEVKSADVLVISVPIYNFGIPASLKAWIDQIARARETFRYSENGPVGLLEGKKAYLVFASGGVPVGSDYDLATSYMHHVLGFIGITDVTVVAADQLMMVDVAEKRAALSKEISELVSKAA
ncbi:FMN-dependent NADH-azoreductase [Roseibium algae]|uniref:FMN dependent NADH:quinone oxidoreductase n=1 Tax=Roseibium algae TaxID=3123038 RepID=A0ABU8TKF8_9HYPH